MELVKFNDKGLVPAIIQDRKTKSVLTLCYMNREALEKTLKENLVWVFRRSKGMLMMKGATSGCVQKVKKVFIDCEGNSLLVVVDQVRAACHAGYFTCYYRTRGPRGAVKVVGKPVFDPLRKNPRLLVRRAHHPSNPSTGSGFDPELYRGTNHPERSRGTSRG